MKPKTRPTWTNRGAYHSKFRRKRVLKKGEAKQYMEYLKESIDYHRERFDEEET